MRYGTKINGNLKPVPQTLTYTNPGEVYEFQIDTEPYSNEEEAITQLLSLEAQVPDLEVVYIDTCPDGRIILQIRDMGPGQISITGVLSLIPHIFILVGIVVVGIMLWQVVTTQPILIWLLALAGGAVVFYWTLGQAIPKPTAIRVPRERKMPKPTKLGAQRVSLGKTLTAVNVAVDDYEGQRRRIEAEITQLKKDKPRGFTREVSTLRDELSGTKDKLKELREDRKEIRDDLKEVIRKMKG